MKKIKVGIFALMLLAFPVVFAQEETPVDYGDNVIIDSDLDGLTDLGEEQKFKTNPEDPDSDGDGMFDGAEVLGGSDPNDPASPFYTKVITQVHSYEEQETPWAWYIARATGIIAFILLYLSMLYGLAIRIPFFNKLTAPILAIDFHKWFSVHATLFALVHGVSLMFDKFINFNLFDVFVPFSSDFQPLLIALGIIAFYLMVTLVLTSYLRKHMPFTLWRIIHHLNIFLYLFVAIHMILLGTDMKLFSLRVTFVAMNIILIFFVGANIANRIRAKHQVQKK